MANKVGFDKYVSTSKQEELHYLSKFYNNNIKDIQKISNVIIIEQHIDDNLKHNCYLTKLPKSNIKYLSEKINKIYNDFELIKKMYGDEDRIYEHLKLKDIDKHFRIDILLIGFKVDIDLHYVSGKTFKLLPILDEDISTNLLTFSAKFLYKYSKYISDIFKELKEDYLKQM